MPPNGMNLYNTEHNNDIRRALKLLCDVLQYKDGDYRGLIQKLEYAIKINLEWRRKMYDPVKHLFYVGSTDVGYHSGYWDMTFQKGKPIPLHPLDATAWGVDDLGFIESLESDAVSKIREAIDKNFLITTSFERLDGKKVKINLYGFMTHEERARAKNYKEIGPDGDELSFVGTGRPELGTFEWSSEVVINVDLYLATSYAKRGMMKEAEFYLRRYISGVKELTKAAGETRPGVWELPYATGFNTTTWEWQSPHRGPSVISNLWMVLNHAAADVFERSFGPWSIKVRTQPDKKLIGADKPKSSLRTTSQDYIRWDLLINGRSGDKNSDRELVKIGHSMFNKHPDWEQIAKKQGVELAVKLGAKGKSPYEQAQIADRWWRSVDRQTVHNNWAVNDTAALLFIMIESYERLGQHKTAVNLAIKLLSDYSMGLVWDPKGWFWPPVISLRKELNSVFNDAIGKVGTPSLGPISTETMTEPKGKATFKEEPKVEKTPSQKITQPQPMPKAEQPVERESGQDAIAMSYISQLTKRDPGYTTRSEPYRAIVRMGEKAIPSLIKTLQDTGANTDTRKWCALLLGEVGSPQYDKVKRILESVIANEGGIYEWWHVAEAKNGLKILLQKKGRGSSIREYLGTIYFSEGRLFIYTYRGQVFTAL